MLTKSKFLKTTVMAALVGLAGIAAVTPASARDFDSHGSSYHRDRDSGWGRDRGHDDRDHRGGFDRHDRFERNNWRWNFRHFHHWY